MRKEVKMNSANALLDFIKNSPSCFHAVKNIQEKLLAQGFEELDERKKWNLQEGKNYFVTRNESLEREFNDLENLCKLLEMICEFQFEFSNNNNLTQKDLLSLIIWTNDHSLELNELLYCVMYFKKENIFKKNIFKEILNKKL